MPRSGGQEATLAVEVAPLFERAPDDPEALRAAEDPSIPAELLPNKETITVHAILQLVHHVANLHAGDLQQLRNPRCGRSRLHGHEVLCGEARGSQLTAHRRSPPRGVRFVGHHRLVLQCLVCQRLVSRRLVFRRLVSRRLVCRRVVFWRFCRSDLLPERAGVEVHLGQLERALRAWLYLVADFPAFVAEFRVVLEPLPARALPHLPADGADRRSGGEHLSAPTYHKRLFRRRRGKPLCHDESTG
mmetsp:Transcript_107708/g.303422  ORF Transcript_107708/g.303422 Transcript_107708/m.303422 type:complete len:245 (+) Transcript_107708:247-981(+)